MKNLILIISIICSSIKILNCQHRSGIITFDREYYSKIYNSIEEYGYITIDTTTLNIYEETTVQEIKHDTTKEVLMRIDSFRYYFNDSIICSLSPLNYNGIDAIVYKYNYKDSTSTRYDVISESLIFKNIRKLDRSIKKDIIVNKHFDYHNEVNVINGINGIYIDYKYVDLILSFNIHGYVTKDIIYPDKCPFGYYPIHFTPLNLIKESEYEKWILILKKFIPKKLDDPLEELKREYNLK